MQYPKFAGKYRSASFKPVDEVRTPVVQSVARRTTVFDSAKSISTPGTSPSSPRPQQYTGTAMIGVATMHKSNMVPVFTDDQARDLASMRR